jgi:hypothetical protein
MGKSLGLVLLLVAASIDLGHAQGSPVGDGVWVTAFKSSCDLVCRAEGRSPFIAGQYRGNLPGNYLICRWRDAGTPAEVGRPGFQHQEGSPNVCKVQGRGSTERFDCLCK